MAQAEIALSIALPGEGEDGIRACLNRAADLFRVVHTQKGELGIGHWVDEIPHQTAITKDNAGISVDFIWYYKVLDPTESVLAVGNFEVAAQGMATTTLRAVIGGIPLDDALSEREHINTMLRTRLD